MVETCSFQENIVNKWIAESRILPKNKENKRYLAVLLS